MFHFFLKNRVGWIFSPTFFLKKGSVGSKPPIFFLKHHRLANYNIGVPMPKHLFSVKNSTGKSKILTKWPFGTKKKRQNVFSGSPFYQISKKVKVMTFTF